MTGQWDDFLIRKWDPYAKAKYDILLDWVGYVRGRTALIVGVGSGEFAAYLAQRGAIVKATDIEEDILALARETARSLNVPMETEVARIETISLDTQYDIVVALDVLEHIDDDTAAMKRLGQLTKSGGSLLLTVPALQAVYGNHDVSLGHYRRYTMSSLTKLIGTNAHIQKIRYFGLTLVPVAWLYSRMLKRPYPTTSVGKASLKRSFLGGVVRTFFGVERMVSPPVGVSLLVHATR